MIERKFIKEAVKRLMVSEYIKKELEKAGIVDIDIQRTTLSTRIGIVAERPGLVIGKKGKSIKDLSESIQKNLGIENPQIEVADVSSPSTEPKVIARWIKRMLERGMKPRRIIKRAVERVMEGGATGVEIIVKGTPSKGSIARKDRAFAGYLKKSGNVVHSILEAKEQALLKQGVMGVTVRIVPADIVFPDKVRSYEEFDKEETKKLDEESKAEEEKEIAEKLKKAAKKAGVEEVE
jgi:small subunit ribosomal protein S3